MAKNIYIFILLISFAVLAHGAEQYEYVRATPKNGDGIYSFMGRYGIPETLEYLSLFKKINPGALTGSGGLILDTEYKLPIVKIKYNGRSIRSTIGIDDFDHAKKIQGYNLKLYRKGLKKGDYRRDKELWVLYYSLEGADINLEKVEEADTGGYEIFGEKYKEVPKVSSKLAGCYYYLVAGHGGPDPGAIGYKAGNQLCEDEYAYDVILRLGRELIKHGAVVYIIVRDPDDGIRDEKYLKCDQDEIYYGNEEIHLEQVYRLRKRAEIVNKLYAKNKNKARQQQEIVIHVDSRGDNEKIDIFFYHSPRSKKGKELAETLYSTIKNKYDYHQPGRGYEGTVTARNLHMLREVRPVGVYIELGNIQNARNQIRLIEENNRQAIAEWLADGLINAKGK